MTSLKKMDREAAKKIKAQRKAARRLERKRTKRAAEMPQTAEVRK